MLRLASGKSGQLHSAHRVHVRRIGTEWIRRSRKKWIALNGLEVDRADLTAQRIADDLASEGLRKQLMAEADPEDGHASAHEGEQILLRAQHPRSLFRDARG